MSAILTSSDVRSRRRVAAGCIDRHGFTLVELLVVIAIIGVLISLLMPAVRKARQAAVTLQCASQMRQFGVAYFMYAEQYSGWLPSHGDFNPLDSPYASPAGAVEPDARFYVEFLGGTNPATFSRIQKRVISLYRCPTGPDNAALVPAWAVDYVGSYSQYYSTNWPKGRARFTMFRRTSATAFLVEPVYVADGSFWDLTGQWLTTRHNRGGNILYLDGHVTWMSYNDFFKHYLDLQNGKSF